MSSKNFGAYGDLETVLTGYAAAITNRLKTATTLSTPTRAGDAVLYLGSETGYSKGHCYLSKEDSENPGTYIWDDITPSSYTPGTGIDITGGVISIAEHAASYVGAGIMAGRVQANATAAATLGNAQVRDIYAGTADMTEGSTALTTGAVYLQYEA